jgi:ATP-dependent DNA helicase
MQLRKVANHPWLFHWPLDDTTGQQMINMDLVNASGKMLLLNRLLDELFARKHKVHRQYLTSVHCGLVC